MHGISLVRQVYFNKSLLWHLAVALFVYEKRSINMLSSYRIEQF